MYRVLELLEEEGEDFKEYFEAEEFCRKSEMMDLCWDDWDDCED